jgi:hypothetical protein
LVLVNFPVVVHDIRKCVVGKRASNNLRAMNLIFSPFTFRVANPINENKLKIIEKAVE